MSDALRYRPYVISPAVKRMDGCLATPKSDRRWAEQMRKLVEKLTAELSHRYAHSLEVLLVDLRVEEDRIELWAGYSLRSDHIMRHLSFPVNTEAAGREALVVREVFRNIESAIDIALATERKSGLKRSAT